MTSVQLYDEKLLFEKIAGGDESAFRTIFDLYKTRLYHFIFKMTKSETTAEELVQEVFMKLWVRRSSLGQVDLPSAYIFVMARNRTVDHLRKVANEVSLQNEIWSNISQRQTTADEILEANESKRIIDEAMAKLSEHKQKIFHLSRVEGLSHEEIAEQLNLSKSTVKNHIVEILRFLKSYLKDHSGTYFILFLLML